MGAYLSFSINESSVKPADNTSVVKVTLYVHSNSGSWNGSSRSGYIQIDGTKYSFSSSFKANTTTTLATKSKTVKHDSDGGGKITIKGYYSTGVSAGNISKTTTHKLKQIDRTSTVKYNVNGGSGSISSQTKTYGKTLTLTTSKPTRTGYTFVNWNTKADGSGTSYASGGSYTANSDVTLYAQWTPIYNTITFTTTALSAPSSLVNYYDKSYVVPTCYPQNGYHLKHWALVSNPSSILVPGHTLKAANSYPIGGTYRSVEDPNETTVKFLYHNGSSWVQLKKSDGTYLQETYQYNQTGIILPDLEDYVTLPENKKFVGWNQNSSLTGSTYPITHTYRWAGNLNAVTLTTGFYAVVGDKDTTDLDVYYMTGLDENSVTYEIASRTACLYGSNYTIASDIAAAIPKFRDYVFSGWFRLDRGDKDGYPENPDWESQGLTNKYVFPYDFNPVDDGSHYNAKYDAVTYGYVISNIQEESNIKLIPFYKYGSSVSSISRLLTTFDYVQDGRLGIPDVTVQNYYSYLSGQTDSIDSVLYGPQVLIAYELICISSDTTLNISGMTAKLEKDLSTGDIVGIDDYREIPITNFYYVSEGGDEERSSTRYYLIWKATLENDYNKAKYRLTVDGLKDAAGRNVESVIIEIEPPDVIRDINADGSVVSFFGNAPEKPRDGYEKEFIINGALTINGDLTGVDSMSLDELYTSTISLDKIDHREWVSKDEYEPAIEDMSHTYGIDERLWLPWKMFYQLEPDDEYPDEDSLPWKPNDEGESWASIHQNPEGGIQPMYFSNPASLKLEKYLKFIAEVLSLAVEHDIDIDMLYKYVVEGWEEDDDTFHKGLLERVSILEEKVSELEE